MFLCGEVFAQSPSIEEAKKEGKVVWYSVVTESINLAREFEKKYPFIKVEVLRMSNERLLNRITTETLANGYNYDVVRSSAFTLYFLLEKGLVRAYDSPERRAYQPGWKDEKGVWTSTDENFIVLGYNTRLVSAADAPKDWKDLLQPRWKGTIGMDPADFELLAALEKKWGPEKATALFKQLAAQNIQFQKGHTLLAQLLAGRDQVGIGLCAPN